MTQLFNTAENKNFARPKLEVKNDTVFRTTIGGEAEDIGPPPAVTIAFYEQSEKPLKLAELPDGYEMVRFDVRRGYAPKGEAGEQEETRISFLDKLEKERNPEMADKKITLTIPQFHALYSVAGASSGWWPLGDKGWNSSELFDNCELYALKDKEGVPVGFGAIERDVDEKTANVNKITFVGISPSLHGQGVGGKFFDTLNAKAWEGADKVKLDTVPELDLMKGQKGGAAATLYEKRGYKLVDSELCTPDDPRHFNQFNLPAFYEGNPTYQTEHLDKRLKKLFETPQAGQVIG